MVTNWTYCCTKKKRHKVGSRHIRETWGKVREVFIVYIYEMRERFIVKKVRIKKKLHEPTPSSINIPTPNIIYVETSITGFCSVSDQ